jgi:hypothetical protein
MRRLATFLAGILAIPLAFQAGRWSRASAVEECQARATQLEHERDEARSQRGTQLASALAIASRGLEQARREPPRKMETLPGSHTTFEAHGDGEPDAGAPNMMSMLFAAKEKGHEALEKMQRATRLSSDQRATLDHAVDAMNLALGDAVERFAKYGGQHSEPKLRDAIPIALDALNALKKADDDFRASLDDTQRRALDTDGFEVVSQVDPMIFLRFLVPPDQQPPR